MAGYPGMRMPPRQWPNGKGHWRKGRRRNPSSGISQLRRRLRRAAAARRLAEIGRLLRVDCKTLWRWRFVDIPSPENARRLRHVLDKLKI